MKSSLKSFALILAICIVTSLVLTLFYGRTLGTLINLGSYVGAAVMLFGCWRTLNPPTPVIEHLHMQQRVENFHAELAGKSAPHQDLIQLHLSSGPLAFSGLLWLVFLQVIRYGFGISLD